MTTPLQNFLTDLVTENFEAIYDFPRPQPAPGPFAPMTAKQREWELWKAEGGQGR